MNSTEPLARFAVHVPADLSERLKNAAVARGMTLAQFCRLALMDRTVSTEAEHNGGQPFPPRPTLAERARQARTAPSSYRPVRLPILEPVAHKSGPAA